MCIGIELLFKFAFGSYGYRICANRRGLGSQRVAMMMMNAPT